jgi:hypothetical protein
LNHRGIEIHYEENLYLEDKRKVVATFMVLINHGAVEDSGLSEEDREINKLWRVSPGSFLVRMKRLPSDLLGDENFEKTIQGPAALVKGAYYPGMEHHLRVVRTDLKMNDKERMSSSLKTSIYWTMTQLSTRSATTNTPFPERLSLKACLKQL